MKKLSALFVVLAMIAMLSVTTSGTLSAAELPWNNIAPLRVATVDVHLPQACNQCGGEMCIQRIPVTECLQGKKEVFNTKIRYEYVTIPETRYRMKRQLVTKKVPAEYCKTVCETEEVERCTETERWEKSDSGCGQVHCKTCFPQTEKVECKTCRTEPGKTTTKVRFWNCIKEPYIVYSQVKRPVCVKQPRYEKVNVEITRYVCQQCGTCRGCDTCGGAGCNSCESGCGGQ